MASDEMELIFRWMQQHDAKMDTMASKQDALSAKLDNHIATLDELTPAVNELNDLWKSSKAMSKMIIPVLTVFGMIIGGVTWVVSHIRYH